jgi:hypothetical protein
VSILPGDKDDDRVAAGPSRPVHYLLDNAFDLRSSLVQAGFTDGIPFSGRPSHLGNGSDAGGNIIRGSGECRGIINGFSVNGKGYSPGTDFIGGKLDKGSGNGGPFRDGDIGKPDSNQLIHETVRIINHFKIGVIQIHAAGNDIFLGVIVNIDYSLLYRGGV